MHIAFVNSVAPNVWGGVEQWMLNVSFHLAQRGHRTVVVGRSGSLFLQRIANRGVQARSVSFRSDIDPLTILHLARLFKRERTDLLCVNLNKELRVGGIAARLIGVRGMVCRKGLPMVRDTPIFRLTYRHWVDRIIVPSKNLKAELTAYPWLDPERIDVIPNGVEVPVPSGLRSAIRTHWGIEQKTKVVGSVGRLVPQKGYQYVLKAAPSILHHHPDVRFVFVGDGRERANLEHLADRFNVRSKVLFAGDTDHPLSMMEAMDVFVLPSIFEPFGQVLIEAMACSRPIVASRVGGIPEVVEDGVTGLLVPPRDPKALVEGILRLLDDEALARAMGAAGRKHVEERFRLSQMIDDVERSFQQAAWSRRT